VFGKRFQFLFSKPFEATCNYFGTSPVCFRHLWICYELFCFLLKYICPPAWLMVQVFFWGLCQLRNVSDCEMDAVPRLRRATNQDLFPYHCLWQQMRLLFPCLYELSLAVTVAESTQRLLMCSRLSPQPAFLAGD